MQHVGAVRIDLVDDGPPCLENRRSNEAPERAAVDGKVPDGNVTMDDPARSDILRRAADHADPVPGRHQPGGLLPHDALGAAEHDDGRDVGHDQDPHSRALQSPVASRYCRIHSSAIMSVQSRSAWLCVRARCSRLSPSTVADRKSTRLNSSHVAISYAVFCLKKKKIKNYRHR